MRLFVSFASRAAIGSPEYFDSTSTHLGFRLFNMFMTEQELTIEITEIDSVKINNVDFSKADENQVLEQFTSNAASAYHEHALLENALAAFILGEEVTV